MFGGSLPSRSSCFNAKKLLHDSLLFLMICCDEMKISFPVFVLGCLLARLVTLLPFEGDGVTELDREWLSKCLVKAYGCLPPASQL